MHIPRSECSVKGVLDMNNIKTSHVLLSVHNDTRPAHIASASDHDNVSSVELDEVGDLALIKIIFDCIVGFNIRIRITKCASIVGGDVENAPIAYSYSTDFRSL